MEFCDICNNMIYIKTEEGPCLVRYCRFCGFEQKDPALTGHCVRIAQTHYSEDELLYTFHQNEFLRFDPALPRVSDPALRCPSACKESLANPRFIYIKYHPIEMKYFYVCDHCGEAFRLEGNTAAVPLPAMNVPLAPITEDVVEAPEAPAAEPTEPVKIKGAPRKRAVVKPPAAAKN